MRAFAKLAHSFQTVIYKGTHHKAGFEDVVAFCLVRQAQKVDNREPYGNLTRQQVNAHNMWSTSVFNVHN